MVCERLSYLEHTTNHLKPTKFNITFVIPTYNRPLLLKRAIRSVIKQQSGMYAIDIVVVDDCSKDAIDISEFHAQIPIQLHKLEQNSGPHVARNKGIELSTGDWIIMLDDDDEVIDGSLSKIFELIVAVKNYEKYPVFFFATTNGQIPNSFRNIGPTEIMDETLRGDFTPVIRKSVFVSNKLQYVDYPEIVGVGCEQLTWLHISARYRIPAFMHRIIKVNSDAPNRLTSYDNFIKNSVKFALQQDITIDFVKKHKLDKEYPDFVKKKYIGASIYYLISGQKSVSAIRRREAGNYKNFVKFALDILSFFPSSYSKIVFRWYKMQISK